MSNPTSNFGWVMPTSTDLVTDLPADFEVFGQAVDTSLAELKGGTTGQILSKASNTSMDFTWITNDVGDITEVVAGTGITGGGTSGAVTVSFDQANFGGGQFAAGKNKIINGDFFINQRNFTSNTAAFSYNFDRFYQSNGGTSGTFTLTPQTFTAGAAPVAGYEARNFLRGITAAGANTNTYAIFAQNIEDVRTLAGQVTTVSFWAKAASGTPKMAVEAEQNFGTGGSPSSSVQTYGGQVTLSTSWARYSVTFTVPSISGKTIGTSANSSALVLNLWTSGGSDFNARTGSMGLQNNTFDIWGVQVEAGSTATPFQTATGTKQGELAACQRYYYRQGGLSLYQAFSPNSPALSTTSVYFGVPVPVTMRVVPSAIDYATLEVIDGVNAAVAVTTANIVTATASNAIIQMSATVASGLTQYRPYYLRASNSTSAYVGFSAEL